MIVNTTYIKYHIYSVSATWYQTTHGPVPVSCPVVGDHCYKQY